MSVPHATRQQIDDMNKIAAQKFGIKNEEVVAQEAQVLHPMLTTHPEPVYEEVQEQTNQEEFQNSESQEEELDDEEVIEEPVLNKKEQNIRNLRKQAERYEYEYSRAERAERERDEAIKHIMSMQQPKQQQQPKIEVEEDTFASLGLEDDSLVEGKHFRELVKEIKSLRSTVKGYEQNYKKNDQQNLEMRLQSQFPDFNKVVTQENLVQLRTMNPDLADSILSNSDQFKQAKLAYDMVKQMGIYKENYYEQDKIIAQRNSVKPRPLTSISPTQSDSPMSKVNSFANAPLTKDLKDRHYQEMLQAMKGM